MDIEIWLDDQYVAKYSQTKTKEYTAKIFVLDSEIFGNMSQVAQFHNMNIFNLVLIVMEWYFDNHNYEDD